MPRNVKCMMIGGSSALEDSARRESKSCLLLGVEELLVLHLGGLESILEGVGVYNHVSRSLTSSWIKLLTLTVGETDGQGLSLGLALGDIGGGIPDPAAVTADVGAQLHVGDD